MIRRARSRIGFTSAGDLAAPGRLHRTVRDSRPRPLDFVRAAAIATVIVLAAAGCSSSNAGWTFAPVPSPTATPAASASAAASAGASAAPSGSGGSAAPSGPGASSPASSASNPAGGGTTGETTVRVVALNLAFDTQQIQGPAGQAFIIEFDNQDQGIPHNIAILDPAGAPAFTGQIVTGPAKATYQVTSLTKGTAYTFRCDVHPTTMTGTVVVQ